MSGYQNQEDLDDIYSDLSEKEEEPLPPPPQPITQIKQTEPIAKPTIKMPDFMGGQAFIPPPPPPSSRPIPIKKEQNQPRPQFRQMPNQYPNSRDRRNVIYIKNIPRTYNRQQTLTTFFRSYGNIKSIKTNDSANTAIVRFEREQDAFRFLQTKPLMFNRSYIVYDSNQEFVVPQEKLQEREKEENVVVVKESEKQAFLMKDNSESILADIYRALLFLNKNKNDIPEEKAQEILKEMNRVRKIKESESGDQHLGEILTNLENDYNWTLSYKILTKQPVDKKKIISQFNKHGPIGTINIKLTQGESGDLQEKTGIVKIKFLGVRSSWEMYLEHHEKLGLEVEGFKLQEVYRSWLVKCNKQLKLQEQTKQQNLQGQQGLNQEHRQGIQEQQNQQAKDQQQNQNHQEHTNEDIVKSYSKTNTDPTDNKPISEVKQQEPNEANQ